jgi:hypothetical protein
MVKQPSPDSGVLLTVYAEGGHLNLRIFRWETNVENHFSRGDQPWLFGSVGHDFGLLGWGVAWWSIRVGPLISNVPLSQTLRKVKWTISAGALTRSGNQLPVPLLTTSARPDFS